MSSVGEDTFSVWETGVFTNGWEAVRLELSSTNLSWFPLKQSFFSFHKEETEEVKGTIVLNQVQSVMMATTADVEPPIGDDLDGLHVIKIRTTNRNYQPTLYAFGTIYQKTAKKWLVLIQERMDQKNFSHLHRREIRFETLQTEMKRWNFGFFSDGWTDNRLELTATGLEWYKMFFDVSNQPLGYIDYQDIHSMFSYISSPVIPVPPELASHLPSDEDLVGKHVFCVLFTEKHAPKNDGNKCGMYLFSFESENDRDLIGEEIWKRRKTVLDNKEAPSSVLPLNPKLPLPTMCSFPPTTTKTSSPSPSPSSSLSSSSSSLPSSPQNSESPYTLFQEENPTTTQEVITQPDSSSPSSSPSSISSFFPKMDGFVPSAHKVRIEPAPFLPSLSSLSENIKNSFNASPSLSSSSSEIASFWGEGEAKGENEEKMKSSKEEGHLLPSLSTFTDRFSANSPTPNPVEGKGQNSSFLSNVASSLGIIESGSERGSERRSERQSERHSEQHSGGERKSTEGERKSEGGLSPLSEGGFFEEGKGEGEGGEEGEGEGGREGKESMRGFSFQGKKKLEKEADAFAQKEFENLSKALAKSTTDDEEVVPANYIEINAGEDDEFDEFDDDFFADAVTTQDYGLPSHRQQEENNDKEFGELFKKQLPAKKAKGIEIRWSEVEL